MLVKLNHNSSINSTHHYLPESIPNYHFSAYIKFKKNTQHFELQKLSI